MLPPRGILISGFQRAQLRVPRHFHENGKGFPSQPATNASLSSLLSPAQHRREELSRWGRKEKLGKSIPRNPRGSQTREKFGVRWGAFGAGSDPTAATATVTVTVTLFPPGRCNPFALRCQGGSASPARLCRNPGAVPGQDPVCSHSGIAAVQLSSARLIPALFILPTARGNGCWCCSVDNSLPQFIIALHYRRSLSQFIIAIAAARDRLGMSRAGFKASREVCPRFVRLGERFGVGRTSPEGQIKSVTVAGEETRGV